jgi:hypothetical protein
LLLVIWPPLSLHLYATYLVQVVVGIEEAGEGIYDEFGDILHVGNLALSPTSALSNNAADAEDEPLKTLLASGGMDAA